MQGLQFDAEAVTDHIEDLETLTSFQKEPGRTAIRVLTSCPGLSSKGNSHVF